MLNKIMKLVIMMGVVGYSLSVYADQTRKPDLDSLRDCRKDLIAVNHPNNMVQQWCVIPIDLLKPTQASVGLAQVKEEQKELSALDGHDLRKKMIKKEVPVVLAADAQGNQAKAQWYLVDRHHFVSALNRNGVPQVIVKIVAVVPKDSAFWSVMQRNYWVWLRDAQGKGILPEQLPQQVGLLNDNPYRSIAGWLEDEGYIDKPKPGYFFEFIWADWLSQHMPAIPANLDEKARKQIMAVAAQLVCSKESSSMLGAGGSACGRK